MKSIAMIVTIAVSFFYIDGQTINYQDLQKGAPQETVFQVGHAAEITVSAMSSDGELAYTASRDGVIKIWKLPELHLIRTITTAGLPVTSMAVTPDGRYIAYSNMEKTVTLVNTQSGETYKTLSGHGASVTAVHCNKEGTFLASTSLDRSVRIWHIPSGITYMDSKDLKSAGSAVVFSDDGKHIAAGFSNGDIIIYDVKAKKAILTINKHTDRITCIVFSSDGSFVVSSDKKGKLVKTILSSNVSTPIVSLPTGITSFILNNDTHCTVTTEDGKLTRFSLEKGEKMYSLQAHTKPATTISFYQPSSLLLTGGDDNTVRLWRSGGKDLVMMHSLHDDWITTAAFSPDGSLLATGSKDKTIKVWQYPSMENVGTFIGHGDEITGISFSSSGNYFVSSSKDSTLRVWNITENMTVSILKGHTGWILSCAFSPDGTMIASSGEDGTIKIWDRSTTTAVKTFKIHKGWVTSLVFSRDGKSIISAGHDKAVKITSIASGITETTLTGPSGSIEQIYLSKDGTLLAAAEQFNKAYVWSLKDGKLLCAVNAHTGSLTSVQISNDSTLFATGGADKIVKLWKTDGTLLKTFSEHSREITQTLFSADDTSLVSVGRDKTLRVWSTSECVPLVSESSMYTSLPFATDGKTMHAYLLGSRVLILPEKKFISVESGSSILAVSETVLAAATQKSIIFYSVASGDLIAEFMLKNGIRTMVFSEDGRILYFNDGAGMVFAYELLTKKDTPVVATQKNIQKIIPIQNGLAVLASDGTGSIIVKNSPVIRLNSVGVKIHDIAVYNDSSLVYTLNDNRTISSWKTDGVLVKTVKISMRSPMNIAVLSGGRTIAVSGKEQGIKVVRAIDGGVVSTLSEKDYFTSIHVSKDFISGQLLDNSVVVMRQSGKDSLRMFMLKKNYVFEYNGKFEYSKELLPYMRIVQGYSVIPKNTFSAIATTDVLSMFLKK